MGIDFDSIRLNSLPLIAEGTKRRVYDIGDGFVLKAAIDTAGAEANADEFSIHADVVRHVPASDLLVAIGEVVAFDGDSMLVMRRYSQPKDAAERFDALLALIPCLDYNAANIGVTDDGRTVLLDYERLHWTWFSKSHNPYVRA